jgi:hypothetical protein
MSQLPQLIQPLEIQSLTHLKHTVFLCSWGSLSFAVSVIPMTLGINTAPILYTTSQSKAHYPKEKIISEFSMTLGI